MSCLSYQAKQFVESRKNLNYSNLEDYMKRLTLFALVVLTMLLSTNASVYAVGVLYSRPLNSSTTYEKAWIKSFDATVQINGQVAVTHVDQTFHNEMNQTVETVWIFPMPEGAVVTELFYWFNGKRYKAEIREAQEARQDYESQIRRYIDPALLEYLGDNLFRLSVAPVNPNTDVRTEITYVELLPYEFGSIGYTFGMDAAALSPKPLNRLSVNMTVETQSPFKSFDSPSHGGSTAFQMTKVTDKKYTVVYGDENVLPDKDLRIEYETYRSDVEVNVLRYTPVPADSIGDDSFYAVWITPPDSIAPDELIPRKIVFTADVSSSMEGTRIQELKTALTSFLDNLNADDHFNIVKFGTSVIPYQPDLVAATPQAVSAAKSFVNDIGALGLTNIDSAMTFSLAQSFSPDCANMIVFITDGYPTWGKTFVPDILAGVKAHNTQNVRIFPFGVGEDVSKPLLVQMATENGGYATFIQQDDSIALVVKNHLTRIAKPVLAGLDIQIDGLATSDKYLRPLPDLFWGSQVMQLGLYQNSGTFPVVLNGTVRGEAKQFQSLADFSGAAGGHAFVPRLWAQAKIDYLLNQIAMYGELAELKNQVIELSLKFQIITPYTSFYSNPTNSVVENKTTVKPTSFVLHQNYPNPFNPETTIRFDLPESGLVEIAVYDITGKLIKVLASETKSAGSYSVVWDGRDSVDNAMPSGIYICRMEVKTASGKVSVKSVKMGLVK
jgi:Ca-activated chloride channel family protein